MCVTLPSFLYFFPTVRSFSILAPLYGRGSGHRASARSPGGRPHFPPSAMEPRALFRHSPRRGAWIGVAFLVLLCALLSVLPTPVYYPLVRSVKPTRRCRRTLRHPRTSWAAPTGWRIRSATSSRTCVDWDGDASTQAIRMCRRRWTSNTASYEERPLLALYECRNTSISFLTFVYLGVGIPWCGHSCTCSEVLLRRRRGHPVRLLIYSSVSRSLSRRCSQLVRCL
jgi:hypothetical protein